MNVIVHVGLIYGLMCGFNMWHFPDSVLFFFPIFDDTKSVKLLLIKVSSSFIWYFCSFLVLKRLEN